MALLKRIESVLHFWISSLWFGITLLTEIVCKPQYFDKVALGVILMTKIAEFVRNFIQMHRIKPIC